MRRRTSLPGLLDRQLTMHIRRTGETDSSPQIKVRTDSHPLRVTYLTMPQTHRNPRGQDAPARDPHPSYPSRRLYFWGLDASTTSRSGPQYGEPVIHICFYEPLFPLRRPSSLSPRVPAYESIDTFHCSAFEGLPKTRKPQYDVSLHPGPAVPLTE